MSRYFEKPESLRELLYNLREQAKISVDIDPNSILDQIEEFVEEFSEIDMPTTGLCVYVGPNIEYCEKCGKPDMKHTHFVTPRSPDKEGGNDWNFITPEKCPHCGCENDGYPETHRSDCPVLPKEQD